MTDYAVTVPISILEVGDLDLTINTYVMVAHYVEFAMTLVTFLYGVTSWYLIRKFRSFNNFVYLNVILVNIMRLSVLSFTTMHSALELTTLTHFLFSIYLMTVYNYWLLVLCYIFYVDVVKVFRKDVKRKFLKSSLFAWGVPLMVLIGCRLASLIIDVLLEGNVEKRLLRLVTSCIFITCNIIPVIINITMFAYLVRSIFCKDTVTEVSKKERRRENCRRLCTATAMFILTNILVMALILWNVFEISFTQRALGLGLHIIAFALFVPLVKSNRVIWHEYYKNEWK